MTSEEGIFQLSHVKAGNYVLEISLVGLDIQEKQITINNDEVLALHLTLKENARQLETVIVEGRKSLNGRPVTIGKFPVAPMDLPQAITVINQQLLKDQQSMRLSDVIKNVNGIYLGTAGGSTQETFMEEDTASAPTICSGTAHASTAAPCPRSVDWKEWRYSKDLRLSFTVMLRPVVF